MRFLSRGVVKRNRFWPLAVVLVALLGVGSLHGQTLRGRVVDSKTGTPLSWAQVLVSELGVGCVTNDSGTFVLTRLPKGTYELVVSYLGYATERLPVSFPREDRPLKILLRRQSFALETVNVMGVPRDLSGSVQRIDQEALQYIQPSSLSDVFQLLPGQLLRDGSLTHVGQVVMRQVSGDMNTALGAAIITDGVPLSNNTNLNTVAPDMKFSQEGKGVVNLGVDLRALSPDHLERVDIVQGIASARYGDLASGAVLMRSKRGVTPWQIRARRDPRSSLLYVGKGFHLFGSTLHAGVDVARATPDERELLDRYTRATGQLTWTWKGLMAGYPLEAEARALYIGTIDAERYDPDLVLRVDSYRAHYTKYLLSGGLTWRPGLKVLDAIELKVSGDYTEDVLRREKTVSLSGGVTPLPTAREEGEWQGIYLPPEYLASYSLVGKPMHIFTEISVKHRGSTGPFKHTLTWGGSMRLEKNYGRGYTYDLSRPPFPQSPYASRPRPFRVLPTMQMFAGYAEDRITARGTAGQLEIIAGGRISYLGNMPKRYKSLHRPYLEPRVNAYYALPRFTLWKKDLVVAFRAAYGEQVKYPTLDMLFPEPVYWDFFSLNRYSQQGPEYSLLWITTRIQDRKNWSLRPNRNKKAEVGIDLRFAGAKLAVTAYRERTVQGFASQTNYVSAFYPVYDSKIPIPPGHKPTIEDYGDPIEIRRRLMSYSSMRNARDLVKWGIEYTLTLPRIQALATSITVNGAYVRTLMDISIPRMEHPNEYYKGEPIPYVGIYAWDRSEYKQRLNTNIWFNTHLPRYRLHFTTILQTVWYYDRWMRPFSGVPLAYLDLDGNQHTFKPGDQDDPLLRFLVDQFPDSYFQRDRVPIDLTINLKATKEIGQYVRLSFFINRIFSYRPDYIARFNRTIRRRTIPFFGAELQVKI